MDEFKGRQKVNDQSSIVSGQRDTVKSINPVTGEVLGQSILHTVDDLKGMISRGRIAQQEWGKLPIKKRKAYLRKVRDYLVEHSDELAETIARDNGKTRIDALATEVLPAIFAVDYYCRRAKRFLRDRNLIPGNIILCFKLSKLHRVPYGVIGVISPWNYPFAIPFSEVVMGLLAGNAVILKVASETQMVGLALQEAFDSAGLPEDIFNYVNLPGKVAGDAFLENGIDKLFFTGSVVTGKYLMTKAGETLTPLCLELGGNDPMIVCEDADLYRAAAGAVWAGFQNAGQSCGGVERIYVQESVYEPFLEILKRLTEALRVGYDTDHNIDMGAMTTQRQIDTVNMHLDDALKKGAKIYVQSQVPQDKNLHNFLPAMVLTEVNHDMLVMKDETFGPIVGVMKYKNIEEAIELANDSYLGLSGSVWTKNRRKGEAIAKRLKVGAVMVNDHLMSHGLAETSWGGFKQSGIGRTHGEVGFNEMTQTQFIVRDILPGVRKDLWWQPFSEKLYTGLRGIIELLYVKSLSHKLRGTIALLKIFPRMFSEK
jgi:succinate-semialdehyde dehydrogenase/glutarate-semialdehyde dehydrogenase